MKKNCKLTQLRDILRRKHKSIRSAEWHSMRRMERAKYWTAFTHLFLQRCLEISEVASQPAEKTKLILFLVKDAVTLREEGIEHDPSFVTHMCRTGQKSRMLQELQDHPRLLDPAVYHTLQRSSAQISSTDSGAF